MILLASISITSLLLNFINAASPYIVTTEGLGQYGYIEKDASPTYFRLSSADYGNIYQLFVRNWISTNILTYGAAPNTCAVTTHSTSNYNFGTLNTGNTIYSSVHADYCGGGNSYGGNPNQTGFNERSFFVMDVNGKTDALVSTVYYSLSNLNVVLTFTISNGNTPSQILNRLWIVNDGTASEGTDINNDAFDLYYEDATGSETFNGTESHATLYGDYNSNSTSNNVYGNDALNISIPQNNSGGLRCYVVLKGTSTYLNSTAKGKNVKTSIIADGISITPNRDTNFSLLKIDKITPSANAITISDEYITTQAGNWNSSATWLGGSIPPLTSATVTIAHNVTIDANVIVNSLTINSTRSLSVALGKQLTVNITLTNNGTLNLLSDATGTATILTPISIYGSGTANVQQYLTSGRNWYISSPVSDAVKATAITTSTASRFAAWNEATGLWIDPIPDATLSVGKGYVAVSPTTSGTITFTGGTLNTGNIPISVSRHTGVTNEGFNLIGNPYPSHITWTTDIAAAANLLPTIWYRTYTTKYDFQTYNAAGTVSVPAETTPYIPPMQAFWVRVATGQTGGTLQLTNEMRSHRTANSLKAPASKNSVQQLLRLQISNGTNSDEAVVYFNPNASNDYDLYDSPKMLNENTATPQIYTKAGTEQLVINGLNSITYNTEIPIGFMTLKKGNNSYSFSSKELINFDPDTKVILKDNQNLSKPENDITDGTPYTFTSDSVITLNRFSIIFNSKSVTTGLNTENTDDIIKINKSGNNQISVTCNNSTPGLICIYNTLGQRFVTKKTAGNLTIIDTLLHPGAYVVSVTNNMKSTTKKIILE